MVTRRKFSREFKLEAVKLGHRARRGCGPGGQGLGRSRERAAQVGS